MTAKTKKKPNPKSKKTRFAYLKTAFSVAGLLIVAYMVYDLLIYDPKPPIDLPVPAEVQMPVPEEPEKLADADEEEQAPSLPDDAVYTVRGGDTWGRIYTQFGVCSWFIINYPPNTGRFGREGSLIAGQRLHIPLKYSGDAGLNPHYYSYFNTDVVGVRCENAGQQIIDAFEEAVQ